MKLNYYERSIASYALENVLALH